MGLTYENGNSGLSGSDALAIMNATGTGANGGRNNAGGNYSQHDENQPMIQKLRQKMGSATNEADRQAIQRTISMLEME